MLRELVIGVLIEEGYNTLAAMEEADKFMQEVEKLKPGKHVYYVGKREISFRKVA